MFPQDPLKSVGYRIIYVSVVIHGLGLLGLIGGSPIRHIAGIIGSVIWSLWMIHGSSIIPWVMNLLGMSVGALMFFIGGAVLLFKNPIGGLSMMFIGIVFGDLARRLCSADVRSNY